MNLSIHPRRFEGRIYTQEGVEASQQLLGEEVHVLKKAHEDLLLRVERPPVLQRAQVVRPHLRALPLEAMAKCPLRYGADVSISNLAELHNGLRPGALYGVAHHKNELRLRHDLADVGNDVRFE